MNLYLGTQSKEEMEHCHQNGFIFLLAQKLLQLMNYSEIHLNLSWSFYQENTLYQKRTFLCQHQQDQSENTVVREHLVTEKHLQDAEHQYVANTGTDTGPQGPVQLPHTCLTCPSPPVISRLNFNIREH